MLKDSVAQLVEQYTFNVWVLGSSPSGITKVIRFVFDEADFLFKRVRTCPCSSKNNKSGYLTDWIEPLSNFPIGFHKVAFIFIP